MVDDGETISSGGAATGATLRYVNAAALDAPLGTRTYVMSKKLFGSAGPPLCPGAPVKFSEESVREALADAVPVIGRAVVVSLLSPPVSES
jgi:hypothetical protein